MNREYEFEDIEDYLADLLSAPDRQAFEKALKDDPELAQRVAALKAEPKLNKLLREAYLLEQFAEWDKAADEKKMAGYKSPDVESTKSQSFLRNWWLPLAAAASLTGIAAIGFTLGWFGTASEPHNANLDPKPSVDTTGVTRAPVHSSEKKEHVPENNEPFAAPKPAQAPSTLDPELVAALDNTFFEEDFNQPLMGREHGSNANNYYKAAAKRYDQGAYKEALELLEKWEQAKDAEYFYLRGYIYYHLGEFLKAEQDFRAIRRFEDSGRKSDAAWCEVFCMARQFPASRKRLDAALQEIIDGKGHYANKALKLKETLRKY